MNRADGPQFHVIPQQMAYIAAGFTGLWILMKFISALRD